ncbi:MAG: ribosomal protein S18-alanine N-acetyltransferase [Desulfovibrionaceae bacterium]|nr:ribosomal protein S18-alanine N-acetyltransferase [Desulfovibrionaceae bacterium]
MIPLPDSIRFRELGESYAAALAELEAVCFPNHGWSAEDMRNMFSQNAFRAYGLLEGSGLAAYTTLFHVADSIEILNIGVLPERRCQKLGRALLERVLRREAETGILRAFLEVRVGNTPAIRLYEGLGFVRTCRRRGYYADTGEDALLYELALPQPL